MVWYAAQYPLAEWLGRGLPSAREGEDEARRPEVFIHWDPPFVLLRRAA